MKNKTQGFWPKAFLVILILGAILAGIIFMLYNKETPPHSEIIGQIHETAVPTATPKAAEAKVPTGQPPTVFYESPLLTAKVSRGELPPVTERLPTNPRVLPVYEQIGQYGGTLQRAYTGLADRWGLTKIIEERIIEFYLPRADSIILIPNWADRFDISEDAKEYRFHIREGLKWSDGVAVTTDDVRFWYEDIFLNKTMMPITPEHLGVNGRPLEIEIVDRYTFTVKFSEPYPFFPEILAKLSTADTNVTLDGTSFLMPFHYLKDFHPTYAYPKALEKAALARGVEKWENLWGAGGPVTSWWLNPDLPVINAWKIKIPPPADKIVMERNPYYFAVDPAGNQLPYIDEIVHTLIKNPEDLSVLAVQRQLDMQDRHIRFADYTFLKLNEAQGDYRIMPWVESGAGLFLNINAENAFLAGLFNDVRFRKAMSISLNRQEIQEMVFNGLGKIAQAGPMAASPHYDAELATKWTAYDSAMANDLLDEIGLGNRDSSGFRLTPEGEAFQITITYPGYLYGELLSDLLRKYWRDIGLHTKWNNVNRSELEENVRQNKMEGLVYLYARNLIIPADPSFFLGTVNDGTWMPRWRQWAVSNGSEGIEPPPDHPIRKLWALWDKAKTSPTIKGANAHVKEMIDIHKENIWVIGLVAELPVPVIIKNNLRNVPAFGMAVDDLRGTGIAQPAQFFFRKPQAFE